ncbi:hypothetical protein EUX98_g8916 [Antrodiella citrinella]|uniref:Ubiquitin-like protease family profile domain-containing protein n=1 Tax=Antrodiella citrinella TaxID=2447956 RepID=A0A4S4M1C5_9APHY|nr:hypothetical protein EUX98_g8916 [Antrodiella citrinella]
MSNGHGSNPFGKRDVEDREMEVLLGEMSRKATSMRALIRGPAYAEPETEPVTPAMTLVQRLAAGRANLLDIYGAGSMAEPGPSARGMSDIEARLAKSRKELEQYVLTALPAPIDPLTRRSITADDVKEDGDGRNAATRRIKDALLPSSDYQDLMAKRNRMTQPYPNPRNVHPAASSNGGGTRPIKAKIVAAERYAERLMPPSSSHSSRSDATATRHESSERTYAALTRVREDLQPASVGQSSTQRARPDPKSLSDAITKSARVIACADPMEVDTPLPAPTTRPVVTLTTAKRKSKDVSIAAESAGPSSSKGDAHRATVSPERMKLHKPVPSQVLPPVATSVSLKQKQKVDDMRTKSAGPSAGKIKTRTEGADRIFGDLSRSDKDIEKSERSAVEYDVQSKALTFATKLSKRWESEVFPERWVPMLSGGFKVTTGAGTWTGLGGETHSLVNTDILRIRHPERGVLAAELYLSDALINIGIQMVYKRMNDDKNDETTDSVNGCNLFDARHGQDLHYNRVDKLIGYLARDKPHLTRALWNRHTILMPVCGESHWYLIAVINPVQIVMQRDPSTLDANVVE